MKTKLTIALAAIALITLSFTFANVKGTKSQKAESKNRTQNMNEPSGGFASEDQL